MIMVFLRPIASHIHEPKKGPMMQPNTALAVAKPSSASVSEN